MANFREFDSRERPPEALQDVYKKFHSATELEIMDDLDLIDAEDFRGSIKNDFKLLTTSSPSTGTEVQSVPFPVAETPFPDISPATVRVYASCSLQGLHFIPELLGLNEQVSLLSKLLHRDLADQRHHTNLHTHYRIPYELTQAGQENDAFSGVGTPTFFNASTSSPLFLPKDPHIHKPLTIQQVLNRKLRWITLGGQYEWTKKGYPPTKPPGFPQDLSAMIQTFFPDMVPEAAIVNIYSPRDTLSLHRDVSEVSDAGLVSISLGCDGIFMAGLGDSEQSAHATFRLRSGDAIYMSGASRYAWHGIPRILRGTCPPYLESWPAGPSIEEQPSRADFEPWRGWMSSKRVNFNVRQMFPNDHAEDVVS